MAARRGGLIANMALARKLAALFWRVMVKGMDFVELGLAQYQTRVLHTKQRALQQLAKQLGQKLVLVVCPSIQNGFMESKSTARGPCNPSP